jgi:hypothetical protein
MAKNIDEALQEAIAEIKSNPDVEEVEYQPDDISREIKPCGYVAKLLIVFHKVDEDSYTFSSKLLYINTKDFTYRWHNGGPKVKKEIAKIPPPE